MSKCQFCGHRNPAGADACQECGAKILERDREAVVDSEPAAGCEDMKERVLEQLRAGKKIAAIKLYREQRGGGLKEAKDAVENLARQNNIVAGGSGCAGVLLLGLSAAATFAGMIF